MSEDKFTRFTTQDNFVSEKIDIIKNNLLGSYDDENQYFISPQIIKELKELKKYKKSSFNNSAFCAGNLMGYGEIYFELEFDEKTTQDNQGKANFYVLENVDKINGYLQNVIRTKIGEFVAPLEDFITKSYAFFNIFDDVESDEGKEKKSLEDLETEDSFILAKKQYSLMLDKLSDEQYLDAYGKYFSSKISLLTSTDNEFCKAVLERFNQQYELIEKLFLNNKNYKVLNELLDKCLEEVSGTKEIYRAQENAFRDTLAPELEEFSNSVEGLNEKFEEKALAMLSKDDKNKVSEIIESEEEHNRQIKEDDDESVVLENSEKSTEIPQEMFEQPKQSENPFEMFNSTGIQSEESSDETQSVEERQQPQQQGQGNVDMDMMKSMFGIDPSFVDDRPVESEGQEESTDIMDMFRKKAEILANSSEYNGEEVEKTAETDDNIQDQSTIEDIQPQVDEQQTITGESLAEQPAVEQLQEVSTEKHSQERSEQEIKDMNDIFNKLRAMSKEKTSFERKEETPTGKVQTPIETSTVDAVEESNSAFDELTSFLSESNTPKTEEFEETISTQQDDVSSYYKPPVFEDEESIREDELYSDGLGSFFGDKFEQSDNQQEEAETADTLATITTDELGTNFSKSQDLKKSNEYDLNATM